MKEILFATGNASKIARFKEKLLEKKIVIKSLKDIGISFEVEGNGKTAIENATIKAKAYYEATGLPTIAMDDTMYINDINGDNLKSTSQIIKDNVFTLFNLYNLIIAIALVAVKAYTNVFNKLNEESNKIYKFYNNTCRNIAIYPSLFYKTKCNK